MQYTIQNGNITVCVDKLGAEVVSVKKNGREYLWQNQTGEWTGRAPLLFPVCGRLKLIKDGTVYPIKSHGFARNLEFEVTAQSEDSISLTLQANEYTREVYPYEFSFTVTYTLKGDRLTIAYTVENPASTPLHFACGGHDAFALENDIGDYELVFEPKASLVHYYHADDGDLTGETKDFGEVEVLPLPEDMLQDSATVIFKGVTSKAVTLREKGGKDIVKVGFEEYEHLLLWRKMSAKYICIEPWTNLPDFIGAPDQEFSQKDGVIEVAPNGKKVLTRVVEFL